MSTLVPGWSSGAWGDDEWGGPSAPVTNPITFAGIISAAVIGLQAVQLTWDNASEAGVGFYQFYYNIYRRQVPDGFDFTTPIAVSGYGQLSYLDMGVEQGQSYCYIIRAVDPSAGEDTNVVEACVTMPFTDSAIDATRYRKTYSFTRQQPVPKFG